MWTLPLVLGSHLSSTLVPHNPAFDLACNGWSLQAFISFLSFRAQSPLVSQLRRYTAYDLL